MNLSYTTYEKIKRIINIALIMKLYILKYVNIGNKGVILGSSKFEKGDVFKWLIILI